MRARVRACRTANAGRVGLKDAFGLVRSVGVSVILDWI